MFTGIIEAVGTITRIADRSGTKRITISCGSLSNELKIGDSIAVSGVCLTVIKIVSQDFSADLALETLHRTSFSRIAVGAKVNLELPMRANGRFDGHIVQGHVDGRGEIVSLEKTGESRDFWLTLRVPSELTRYIIEKGSLTIEGISLTVASIDDLTVRVAIIPHTAEVTNLASLRPGDPVNLEVDVLAKYVEKMFASAAKASSLTVADLRAQGF